MKVNQRVEGWLSKHTTEKKFTVSDEDTTGLWVEEPEVGLGAKSEECEDGEDSSLHRE
jgi:hypothetical protein